MLLASCAAFSAANWPAKGVDLRLPLMLILPGVAHEITLPLVSVKVTIVVLKGASIWATPTASTCFDFLRLLRLSGGKGQSSPFGFLLLGRGRFLAGNGPTRPLAGTGVGLGALALDR